MKKEQNTDKPQKKAWSIANVRHWLYFAYLTITYRVFHLRDNEHNGWFVKKNPITMLLIAPILLPFFMLYGILLYWDWATNYYFNWIEGEKRKLSFREKLAIKYRLVK